MHIVIKYFGIYQLLLGKVQHLDVKENSKLSQILYEVNEKISILNPHLSITTDDGRWRCKIVVNNTIVHNDIVLNDEDEIKLMPIIGGG